MVLLNPPPTSGCFSEGLRSPLGLSLVLPPLLLPGPLQVYTGDPINQTPCREDQLRG